MLSPSMHACVLTDRPTDLKLSFLEKQKPQFLCRTELTGALGAILAQDPRAPDDEICFSGASLPPRGTACSQLKVSP